MENPRPTWNDAGAEQHHVGPAATESTPGRQSTLVFLVILAAQLFVPMPYAEFPTTVDDRSAGAGGFHRWFPGGISLLIVGLAV
ncbi:MAG: hypothetical protein IPK16_27470 [Anaerolineales bacterium]|nr:hypothetical protein [Anaerolineales bacterium]